jgi:NAD(P)-dependent dehydrogenase (short-subunit alcohol dehydrogenase family)
MDLQLEGKRALITGSTAGIGYAIAEALVQEGASVIVNGRTKERVERAVEKLRALSSASQVDSLAADLGTAAAVQQAIRQFPEVDILINNLGIFEPKPFEEISDEDWLRLFEVNVLSGVA